MQMAHSRTFCSRLTDGGKNNSTASGAGVGYYDPSDAVACGGGSSGGDDGADDDADGMDMMIVVMVMVVVVMIIDLKGDRRSGK